MTFLSGTSNKCLSINYLSRDRELESDATELTTRQQTRSGKMTDYYELETNYTINNLAAMIEPVILLFMGVLVGFIALAIFMPMWNMMNIVKG